MQVYPTLVIRGTGLYELWKQGLYRNYPPDKVGSHRPRRYMGPATCWACTHHTAGAVVCGQASMDCIKALTSSSIASSSAACHLTSLLHQQCWK